MSGIELNPKRVLLVDDESSMLRICERALAGEGFEVVPANTGEDAIRELKKREFGVIFTDLNMPGIGGKDLLKYVRQNHSSICVNIFTGAGTIEGAVECMRLGACGYITKPFDLGEFTAMAFRCMGHYDHRLETARLKKNITAYEELDKLKSEFVSNVSHELRTPIFSMSGALELLLQSLPEITDGTSKKLCEVIQHNLTRLTSIVSNILNFSRIEKGTLIPSFREVDLAALAQKAAGDLHPLFAQRNISIEPAQALLPSGAVIEADPEQIEQVLINLLANAIKFTPRGGRIGIALSEQGDAIILCVWDTGCGIDPQYHTRIFDRFYQVDGSITRETGGTGIGLAIVKSIVQMHGGRIWVESSPGQGTRMNVYLPRRRKTPGPLKEVERHGD
jgi:nitrogen-specific signal transduction histidine kinase